MEAKKTKKTYSTSPTMSRRIVFTALFAALIAVCGFISIPIPGTPVPIVLQNMISVLTGLMLGPLWGTLATILFLVAGALGLPIFSGGSGGIARLMGPTGGFLFGYALATLTSGLIAQKPVYGKKILLWRLILATVAGFVVMYIPGVIHYMNLRGKSLAQTMVECVLPFVIGDVIKMVLAVLLSLQLRNTAASYIFKEDIPKKDSLKEDKNE